MIDDFAGPHSFLSNFYPSVIVYGDATGPWITVEHAFAAAKTTDRAIRERIRRMSTPGQAKAAGRSLILRPDWEAVKDAVMLDLLRLKFAIPTLNTLLLRTHPHALIEGNTWHDRIWGVCTCPRCGGAGENRLGRLLVQVREEIV